MDILLRAGLMLGSVVGVIVILTLVIWRFEKNKEAAARAKWDQQEAAKVVEKHRLSQLKDEQNNHGRRVFNWLSKILNSPEYRDLGFHIWTHEGDKFQITINLEWGSGPNVPVLQMDYDFRKEKDQRGHIFYEAYGPDISFAADKFLSFDYGLHKLIVETLERDAERKRKLIKALAA